MNILLCAGFSRTDHSLDSFKRAFEELGHTVITCGPEIGNFEYEPFLETLERVSGLKMKKKNPLLSTCDIKVYDKPHPERYSYEEIMQKVVEKNYRIDLILQRDPHFFLSGQPPKEIPTAYYLVDIHRGGKTFLQMALEGNFNYLFLAYKHYIKLFLKYGLKPFWLSRAFDDTFIREYPEIEQQCDVAFCGTTGISSEILDFPYLDVELGRRYHEGPFPDVLPKRRYQNWKNRSMEYSERAELLIRLSKDFRVRIYEKKETYPDKIYPKILCRGKIGFNRSLRKDLTLRNFEIMACNRLLITDEIPEIYELFEDEVHLRIYGSYYQPQFADFDLDYEEVKYLVDYYLDHEDERKEIACQARNLVFQKHTEKHRVKQILDTIFN